MPRMMCIMVRLALSMPLLLRLYLGKVKLKGVENAPGSHFYQLTAESQVRPPYRLSD